MKVGIKMKELKEIIKSIPIILGSISITKIMNKKYKLERNIIEKHFTIKTPFILKQENKNKVLEQKDNEINDIITEFIEIITNTQPKENIENLNNNLATLKIKNEGLKHYLRNIRLLIISERFSPGGYHNEQNKIILINTNLYPQKIRPEINPKELRYVINHELLHFASSVSGLKQKILNKGTSCTGFYQSLTDNIEIGRGLNEGYTEFLNNRYFIKNYYRTGYDYEMSIAQIIEKIIGRRTMENLYFNANLEGLVQKLSKYIDINEAKKLILNLDLITKSLTKSYISNEDITMCNQKIIHTLTEIIKKKYTTNSKEDITEEKEYYEDLKTLIAIIKNTQIKIKRRLKKEPEKESIKTK